MPRNTGPNPTYGRGFVESHPFRQMNGWDGFARQKQVAWTLPSLLITLTATESRIAFSATTPTVALRLRDRAALEEAPFAEHK